jgi:hypothetical protein
VLGKDLPPGTGYLTLSHCWGTKVPKRLLKENISTMMAQIPFSELSKTFQDAVTFTRNIGHRYIWIDSLCIVQDDVEDWQVESVQMGKVYTMSICNLSATAAKDGSQGLFYTHQPMFNQLPKVNLNVDGKTGLHFIWDRQDWGHGVEKSPLNSRAWVCQERFLSPCNLHFSAGKLFWECKELSACEILPNGYPNSMRWKDFRTKQTLSHGFLGSSHAQWEKQFPGEYAAWGKLVEKYTAAKLTFRGDKLVAFSGLAAAWSKAKNDCYIAGLWKSRLPEELMWSVTSIQQWDYGNGEYTAPSASFIQNPLLISFRPVFSYNSSSYQQG